jgi:putrescine transport system permease protein
MKRGPSLFNLVSIGLGLAFLYVPILVLIAYSFNASRLVTVWGGVSTRWYVALFEDARLMEAIWVTVRVGAISATLATALGVFAAIALVRAFRGARPWLGGFTPPW